MNTNGRFAKPILEVEEVITDPSDPREVESEIHRADVTGESPEPTRSWSTRGDALKASTSGRKPLILLGGGLAAAVVLFLVTSFVAKSPTKRVAVGAEIHTANAEPKSQGSVTPLMDSVHNSPSADTGGQLTPADIHRTKVENPTPKAVISTQVEPVRPSSDATLASVPPFTSTQQHWEEPRPYGETQPAVAQPAGTSPQNLMKEASLVFVKKVEPPAPGTATVIGNGGSPRPVLSVTPGTRIQARLETQASSAVNAPVVAVVQYTYSVGGDTEIPAGARVYGQLQQADRSGTVSIKFNEIQYLDGNRQTIEAIGTSLDMGPLKGVVYGKNTGRNFLVKTASGIGSVAAMLVGNNSSAAFSEDDLIRQRVAENVGNAGDTEIMNMALTNKIIVSVPADTAIYIVFLKHEDIPSVSRLSTASKQ